jgi:hypothetical protein
MRYPAIADGLRVQRTGHTETEAPLLLDGPTPHTGYWAVVSLYTSTSCLVYRARGFRDGAPRVQGAARRPSLLKDIENLQSIHFSCFLRAGVGPGWFRGWFQGRVLRAAFGIQLAVAAAGVVWNVMNS